VEDLHLQLKRRRRRKKKKRKIFGSWGHGQLVACPTFVELETFQPLVVYSRR
jgi:hypothetical protein